MFMKLFKKKYQSAGKANALLYLTDPKKIDQYNREIAIKNGTYIPSPTLANDNWQYKEQDKTPAKTNDFTAKQDNTRVVNKTSKDIPYNPPDVLPTDKEFAERNQRYDDNRIARMFETPGFNVGNLANQLFNASMVIDGTALGTKALKYGFNKALTSYGKKAFTPNLSNIGSIFKPPTFISDIDWGAWNSKIPSNKLLMDEYIAIEKAAKADGSWMKNKKLFSKEIADAEKEYAILAKKHDELYKAAQWKYSDDLEEQKKLFEIREKSIDEYNKLTPIIAKVHDKLAFYKNLKLTPEQFVQIQSKNFKNAFPDGFDRFYRGAQKFDADFIGKGSYRDIKDGNILFGTNQVPIAQKYSRNGAFGRNLDHYFNAINQPEFLKPTSKGLPKEAIQLELDNLLNPGVLDLVYDKNIKKTIIDANNSRWESVLHYGKTDDIAAKIKSGELNPVVKIKNIHDGSNYFNQPVLSNVTMIDPNHVKVKSLRYNNGMFDMTNPNIFKSLIPTTVGIGISLFQQNETNKQNRKQGGKTHRKRQL